MASKTGRKGPKMSQRQAFQNLQQNMVASTNFDRDEVDSLLKKFHFQVPQGHSKLDRPTMRDILHKEFSMTDDMIMDRVFKAFDRDNDGKISAEEWCKGMSVFLRGNAEERIAFAFEVYDMNSDGYISKEEMFHMLKHSLQHRQAEEDPDEGVKDLVDLLLKKIDIDLDNRVSKTDFRDTIKGEPLLLECLGQCMPDHKRCCDWMECMCHCHGHGVFEPEDDYYHEHTNKGHGRKGRKGHGHSDSDYESEGEGHGKGRKKKGHGHKGRKGHGHSDTESDTPSEGEGESHGKGRKKKGHGGKGHKKGRED